MNDPTQAVRDVLGELPWGEEDLRRAVFVDFGAVREVVDLLPGGKHANHLRELRLSHQIFNDAAGGVAEAIDAFFADPAILARRKRSERSRYRLLDRDIRRSVLTAAAAAMALVDHVRKGPASNDPEFNERIRSDFAEDPQHRFVQDLRNYVCHHRVVSVDWKVSWQRGSDAQRQILLSAGLLTSAEFGPVARTFIQENPEGIDLRQLFAAYRSKVDALHEWLQSRMRAVNQDAIQIYEDHKDRLRRVELRIGWHATIGNAIQNGVDPYDHLHAYFDDDELEHILALKKRSKAQVDKAIELYDSDSVVDEKLRDELYRLFGTSETTPD